MNVPPSNVNKQASKRFNGCSNCNMIAYGDALCVRGGKSVEGIHKMISIAGQWQVRIYALLRSSTYLGSIGCSLCQSVKVGNATESLHLEAIYSSYGHILCLWVAEHDTCCSCGVKLPRGTRQTIRTTTSYGGTAGHSPRDANWLPCNQHLACIYISSFAQILLHRVSCLTFSPLRKN